MNPGLFGVPPILSNQWKLIDKQIIIQPTQAVDFKLPMTDIDCDYAVEIYNVRPSTPSALAFYMGIDGGPPRSGATDYAIAKLGFGSSNTSQSAGGPSVPYIGAEGAGNNYTSATPANGGHVIAVLSNASRRGEYKRLRFTAEYEGSSDAAVIVGGGWGVSAPIIAGQVTSLYIQFTAGTISSGEFYLHQKARGLNI